MATQDEVRQAFRIQAHYCRSNAAPLYALVADALACGLTRDSATGRRVLDWPGEPTRDAVPLRLIGGLHALVLAAADAALVAVYRGDVTDPGEVAALLQRVLVQHDAALLPWLDGPPQTNEPGRSAALMVGLIEVARRYGPTLEVLEIGSSAGLNLMIGRYRIDLGGTVTGPADAAVRLTPDWRGPPPVPVPVEVVSARGCDVAPLDATDPAVEARLAAYVWPDAPERMARLRAAVGMMRRAGVALERADAADWMEARLAEPQAAGVTRVLMHSVVWQYLPEPTAARIRDAMAAAGERATRERPLAWVAMEPDRTVGHQLVRMRSWPDADAWEVLAESHAHGAWVSVGEDEAEAKRIELPAAARVEV